MRALPDLVRVLRNVENPLHLLLDRANLRRRSYVLRTRDGLEMEIRPQRGDRYIFYEAEYDIFRAMDERTARRIDQITMEVHHVPDAEPQAVRSLLTKLGFQQESASLLYAWR